MKMKKFLLSAKDVIDFVNYTEDESNLTVYQMSRIEVEMHLEHFLKEHEEAKKKAAEKRAERNHKIMKYYYGNDMKEALSNPPVGIKTTAALRSYQEVYAVVIPADEVNDDAEE